jgi:hypothetical protein
MGIALHCQLNRKTDGHSNRQFLFSLYLFEGFRHTRADKIHYSVSPLSLLSVILIRLLFFYHTLLILNLEVE